MKFICERDELHRAISAVISRTRSKHKAAVLQHLKFEVASSSVTLTATDFDTRSIATLAAEVETPGARLIPADRLAHLIPAMPSGSQLRFDLRGLEINIANGSSRYRLPTLDAADFPEMDDPHDPVVFQLGCLDVKSLFGDPQGAILLNSGFMMLEGGCIYQPSAGRLAIVATDKHRFIKRSLPTSESFDGRYIVPKSAMTEIVKLAFDGEVNIAIGANLIEATSGNVTFTSKLIAEKYPNIEPLIVAPEPRFILLDRAETVLALKRLMGLEGKGSRVRLSWAPGQPFQMLLNGDGFGSEQVTCECDLEAGQLSFQPAILAQMLDVFKGEVLHLHPKTHDKPMRIVDPADPDLVVMAMPCVETQDMPAMEDAA